MLTLAASDTIAGVASVASQVTCTIFGMELINGVESYKVLDQRQLPSSVGTIYTVPANAQAFIKTIMVNNNDTAVRTFRLFRGGTGNANAITPTFSLLPQGCAIYEDGHGWRFYNSAGQLLQGMGNILAVDPNYSLSGFLAESINRMECPEANVTIPTASGTLFMQGIFLPAGITVSNISWFSATTGATSPTACRFGLYSVNRNLLATSAQAGSAAWGANTLRTLPMITPYVVPTSGLYYVGMYLNASTIITSKGGTSKTGGQLAAQAPILHGTSNTGLTDALPDPANAITPGLVCAWTGVS